MATINGNYKYDANLLYVANGDKSDDTDINDIADTVNTSLGTIETDMALVNASASLAKSWATADRGTDLGTDEFSAEAEAIEAKGWANADDGAGIPLADGTTSTEESAKTHAANAYSSATAAATSANFVGLWSDQSGGAVVPTSVYHNGDYWNLLVGLADITASEPSGTNSDWAVVTQGANKNLLINPNMAVNQEKYTGETITSSQQIYDMWQVVNVGSFPYVGVSGKNITIASASLAQTNDDLIALSNGSDVTLTASVASGSVFFSDRVDESAVITPSSPLTFIYNSSAAAKILIGADSGTYTFSGLKLEVGSIATPYEIPQVTEEELKCYRYYYRYPADGMFCLAQRKNLAEAALNIITPVPMKSPVVISVPDYTSCFIVGNGASTGLYENFSYGIPHGCNIIANEVMVLDSLSANHIYHLYTSSPTYLELDARY